MSAAAPAGREFGVGPLSRISAFVYNLLVIELLFLVSGAPGLVALALLGRDVSNLPLVAVCALPLGPALSAALYAWQRRSRDLTDLSPAPTFWRGYRLNVKGALQIWVPCVLWLTIVAVNLAHLAAAAVPGWWAVLLLIVAAAVTLWGVNALVITSLFAFRARDVARLAAYFMIRTPVVALGTAGLLIAAVVVASVASAAAVALLASLLAAALLRTCQPMTARIRAEFTTGTPPPQRP